MGFPETVKTSVRRKSHLQCCLCKSLGVEIHHIIPQAEGGPDTEDNAAPLCPSCHETYGANPVKRKMITEARDLWYEVCERRYAPDADRVERLINLLEGITPALPDYQAYLNRLAKPETTEPEYPTIQLKGEARGSSSAYGTLTMLDDEDEEEFQQESRTELETLEVLEKLFDQIWYNRHLNHRIGQCASSVAGTPTP